MILCFPSDKDKCMRKVFVCAHCTHSFNFRSINLNITIYLETGRLEFFITSCGVVMLIDLLNGRAILYNHQQLLFKFKGESTKRKNKENCYSTKLNLHALACGRICRHLSVGGAALSKTIFTLFTLCAQSF